jgi:hypothetical protein
MSQPDTLRATYVDVVVEDPASSGTFVQICGLTTKSFNDVINSSDVYVPDCGNPEDIPERRVNITGRQRDISGEGLYNRAQAALLRTLKGQRRNYRFVFGEPSSEGIDSGYWEGPAILLTTTQNATGAENVTSSMAWASDGEWNWVDA